MPTLPFVLDCVAAVPSKIAGQCVEYPAGYRDRHLPSNIGSTQATPVSSSVGKHVS